LEYTLVLAELRTYLHDSHAFLDSPTIFDYVGRAAPPFRARFIEGSLIVESISDTEAAHTAGIEVGDIILQIDGQDMAQHRSRLEKIIAASTPQWKQLRLAHFLLAGAEGSTIELSLRGRDGQQKLVRAQRKAQFNERPERGGDIVRILPGNVGYVDLARLTVPMVDSMFEQLATTRAIIFDNRGYPKGTAWSIAPRLTEKDRVVGARFRRPVLIGPSGPSAYIGDQAFQHEFAQLLPSTQKSRYKGKTLMLIDERTISQAEHTGLFFEAAAGTKLVGSPTCGANGDVTTVLLPGGITMSFTGQAVFHADGRQLQRIGLIPDIEVRPTIAGIQAGRDEVLENALASLD
jgi:C-terminal processing protease CtpA/Prc